MGTPSLIDAGEIKCQVLEGLIIPLKNILNKYFTRHIYSIKSLVALYTFNQLCVIKPCISSGKTSVSTVTRCLRSFSSKVTD